MQKIMYVEGMMCAHCEARVRKALEALPFVEKAEPDHSAGRVTVTLSAPGSDGELTRVVTEASYTVRSIGYQSSRHSPPTPGNPVPGGYAYSFTATSKIAVTLDNRRKMEQYGEKGEQNTKREVPSCWTFSGNGISGVFRHQSAGLYRLVWCG